MANPFLRNNLELEKSVAAAQEIEIKLSKENVELTKENEKLEKLYLELKTKTEATQNLEVSEKIGSISTVEITCLGISAIGLVTAAMVLNEAKKKNQQKGAMYLIDKEQI